MDKDIKERGCKKLPAYAPGRAMRLPGTGMKVKTHSGNTNGRQEVLIIIGIADIHIANSSRYA